MKTVMRKMMTRVTIKSLYLFSARLIAANQNRVLVPQYVNDKPLYTRNSKRH